MLYVQYPAFPAFPAPAWSVASVLLYPALIFGVSSLDTRSIQPWYSEYQGWMLVFDTFVKFSIMPSLVQEMQEMQVFCTIAESEY